MAINFGIDKSKVYNAVVWSSIVVYSLVTLWSIFSIGCTFLTLLKLLILSLPTLSYFIYRRLFDKSVKLLALYMSCTGLIVIVGVLLLILGGAIEKVNYASLFLGVTSFVIGCYLLFFNIIPRST